MKKIFYTILMMVLTTMISFFLYLSVLTLLARYRIIPLNQLDRVLGILMSQEAYLLVGFLGVIWGYLMAAKWWKIIYIDGVYYFNTSKKRDVRRRIVQKTKTEGK
ncbi:MAG: hypothetical protein HHAS10_07860 [Candidatus Altimarinota bacterium]